MDEYSRQIIKLMEENLPDVLNNAEIWFAGLITILAFFFFVLWIYCGFFMFYDSMKRFGKSTWVFLLFVIGVLFGPFALILYLIARPRKTLEDKAFMHLEHRFFYNEASKVIHCLNCDSYVLENHVFCTQCGTQNRYRCPKCGALTDYDDKYCWKCGYNFGDRYQKILQTIQTKKSNSKSSVKQLKKTHKGSNYSSIRKWTQKIDSLKKVISNKLDAGNRKLGNVDVSQDKKSKPNDSVESQKESQKELRQESHTERQKESKKVSTESLSPRNNSKADSKADSQNNSEQKSS
ncbi:MAG: hypothetical protein KatS3mg083_503 [Candidatus Dojkabacteria bacterium]|nr:MAG: hypothetical protein KatS3mg083_503 [Candidatus Dojkabacteria bacterium]